MTTAWVDFLGAEVRYYDAGGVRTRVVEAGSGEPLILLHGMGGHAETFMKNVVPLSEHFHVYALDLLGMGFTGKPDVEYTVASFADHVRAFMDCRSIDAASFAGQSLGGWIAGWLAVREPRRVRKLVHTTGAGLQVHGPVMEQVRTVVSSTVTDDVTRDVVRKRLEWLMYDTSKVTDELVEIRYQIYSKPDAQRAMAAMLHTVTGEPSKRFELTPEALRESGVPIFFLWSDHNPTTQASVAEAAHRQIPGSRFHVIRDAAHWPQYEQPDEFNRLAREFLLA